MNEERQKEISAESAVQPAGLKDLEFDNLEFKEQPEGSALELPIDLADDPGTEKGVEYSSSRQSADGPNSSELRNSPQPSKQSPGGTSKDYLAACTSSGRVIDAVIFPTKIGLSAWDKSPTAAVPPPGAMTDPPT